MTLSEITKKEAWIWYIKSWLQLFRAQTAPLTIIIVLTAYLHGVWEPLTALFLIILVCLIHYFSYGHNSLMDTAMGYDTKDPSKQHHPLISGVISLTGAHHVIHLGLIILSLIAVIITLIISPAPIFALIFLFMWVLFGQAYNDGLSKESLLASPIISLMTVCMVAWGWLLSHDTFDIIGILFLIYVFLLIMFQISWDGSLKDIRMPEKSNVLVRLGVKIEKKQIETPRPLTQGYLSQMIDYIIIPPNAWLYGWLLKAISFIIIIFIFVSSYKPWLLWLVLMIWIIVIFFLSFLFWNSLINDRPWNHDAILQDMSFEQIFAIYLPIPLLVHPVLAILLMVGGIIYFWGFNRFLWETTFHPRV